MPTDRDIAQLCLSIYSGPDGFDQAELPDTGIAFGLKDFGSVTALIFRGSSTFSDFVHDSECIADPLDHDELGPVHPGFFEGLPDLWTRLQATLAQKPCVVAGHSLGAARASLFTGLMVVANQPPIRRLCFGEPRPGFPQSASIIAEVTARSFCNGNGRAHDLVTDVPFTTWIEDYVHATPLIPICVAPSEADVEQYLLFAWHPMPLYASGTPPVQFA